MQNTIVSNDISVEGTDIRYQIYHLLAHLFRQAPDQACLDWLSALELDVNVNSDMTAIWAALQCAASQTCQAQVSEEYQDLFIGIGRGEVMPFGSWYLSGALMGLPLAYLREDLMALGFARQDETKEPEDHIAALLEVMAMLVEDNQNAEQKMFFNQHIAPWFETFCKDVIQAKTAGFYRAVAALTNAFLIIEKTQFIQRPW